MLTPAQIKEYTFQPAGRGVYKSEEVDELIANVAASFEQKYNENSELVKRVSLLAEKLTEYRRDEELIQKTLLVAQRKADELEDDAKTKSDYMIISAEEKARATKEASEKEVSKLVADATFKATTIVAEAEAEAEKLTMKAAADAKELIDKASNQAEEKIKALDAELAEKRLELSMLKNEVSAFRENLISLYSEHLKLIEKIPSAVSAVKDTIVVETQAEETEEAEEIEEIKDAEDIEEIEEVEEIKEIEDVEEPEVIEEIEEPVQEDEAPSILKVDDEDDDEPIFSLEEDEDEDDAYINISSGSAIEDDEKDSLIKDEKIADTEDEAEEFDVDDDEEDEADIQKSNDIGFNIFSDDPNPSNEPNGFRVYLEKFINEDDDEPLVIDDDIPIRKQFGVFDEVENKDDNAEDSQSRFKGFFKK